ncbi:MAG: hypothetical protein JWO33_696 [Caulobacteraceae bacterium]|nr:hypothetical protein [Caulobacteraceae bacterium]
MRRTLQIATMAGLVLGLAGTALASGGGGGGDSAAPSMSAPAYDAAAEYARGMTALQAQDYKQAITAFGHVTQVVPREAGSWGLLGAAKAGAGDWKGSRQAYQRAMKLTPDDAGIHAGLGLALGNLKDPKAQAELDWLKARAATCGDGCAEAASLKSYVAAVESAIGASPSARLIAPGPMLFASAADGDAVYLDAVGLINERRYDDALQALARAELVFGPHPDVITYQGYVWRKKGDYGRAEGYYRQALAIAPSHRGALEYYGELKVERGDLAGARRLLARLDRACAYGCAESEELRRWIDAGRAPQS